MRLKQPQKKRLNKPQRCNVLLELNKPWEGKYNTFFCPIYAEVKWRLYYTSTLSPKEKYVSYAESDDGQSWTRPSLGIVYFHGSKDNNIIMIKKRTFIAVSEATLKWGYLMLV
jgi:hypothetical protein